MAANTLRDFEPASWVDKRRLDTDTRNIVKYEDVNWNDEYLIEEQLKVKAAYYTPEVLNKMSLNDKRYALRLYKDLGDMESQPGAS